MSELKTTKDALVASLFELSKAAQEAASAAVNFYKAASVDGANADQLTHLSATLGEIAKATISNGESIIAASGDEHKDVKEVKKKKEKVKRDPNAPKKPLTMYFAFSFHTRKEIAEERKKQGLPSLSAVDMNSLVKERWSNISDEEKQAWQDKYKDELKRYNIEKVKYQAKLDDDKSHEGDISAIDIPSSEIVEEEEEVEPKEVEEVAPVVAAPAPVEAPKKSHKKRKSDKEKGEKKKSKKSSSSSH